MSPPEVDSTKDVEKKPSQRRGPRPSKLEKADILEMTVEFIKRITPSNVVTDKDTSREDKCNLEDQNEYSAGYAKCLSEISKYLEETRSINDVSKKLVEHISHKLQSRDQSKCDSSQPVPLNRKIQIQPLQKLIPIAKVEDPNQAIDLSLRNKQDGQKDASIMHTRTGTDKNSPSLMGNVINQQLPVSLVCGSHVMLLLQVPNSMTSSQDVTTLFPQLQTVSGSTIPTFGQIPQYPVLLNSVPSVTPNRPEVNSQTDTAHGQKHPIVVQSSAERASVTKEEKTDRETGNVEMIDDEQGDKQNVDLDHWRPW